MQRDIDPTTSASATAKTRSEDDTTIRALLIPPFPGSCATLPPHTQLPCRMTTAMVKACLFIGASHFLARPQQATAESKYERGRAPC